MASKSIVANLNKGKKLDGDNYDIWHRKIQYLLDEQEVLETLTQTLTPPPKDGTGAQHQRDQDAYKEWAKKDRCARFVMLSSMHNDLISVFEDYKSAREMWDALKAKFGSTSATRLRALTLKFDSYKMRSNTSMKQHLRQMSTMIRELKAAGNNLSDEQQVQAGIRSLPDSWEHMRVNMTHNENIKNFDDLARHLELEAERLEAANVNNSAYMVHSGSRGASGSKRKYQNNGKRDINEPAPKKTNFAKRKRGKRGGKKGLDNKACFNCAKEGHFARDCAEPKKEQPNVP